MDATKIPDAEFKTIAIRMIKALRGRMDNLRENVYKKTVSIKKDIEITHTKKKQSEMKNTISEMKNTLEGINSRLDEAED